MTGTASDFYNPPAVQPVSDNGGSLTVDGTVAVSVVAGTADNLVDVAVGGAAVTIVPANANRKSAIVQNTGTANMRVAFDGVAPTATLGLQLVPGQWLSLSQPFCPTSAIQAIREGATSTTASGAEVV